MAKNDAQSRHDVPDSLLLAAVGKREAAAATDPVEYLEQIGARAEFPSEEEYLDELLFATVKAEDGKSVPCCYDGDMKTRLNPLPDWEPVLLLAARGDARCVITLKQRTACWVKDEVLANRYYANERAIESALGREAREVRLTEAVFPDAAFRNYLISFDEDGDGTLRPDELSRVTEVSCPELGIASLRGLEQLSELTALDCRGNGLTELDVSGNRKLTSLNCSENQLTELNLGKNRRLEILVCDGNQLTELDLRENRHLWQLSCGGNRLRALDLSGAGERMYLNCNQNGLEELSFGRGKT